MQELYKEIVEGFGTQGKAAKALEVSQPTVYKWVSGSGFMSAGTAIKVERLTDGKYKATELCPDLQDVEQLIVGGY